MSSSAYILGGLQESVLPSDSGEHPSWANGWEALAASLQLLHFVCMHMKLAWSWVCFIIVSDLASPDHGGNYEVKLPDSVRGRSANIASQNQANVFTLWLTSSFPVHLTLPECKTCSSCTKHTLFQSILAIFGSLHFSLRILLLLKHLKPTIICNSMFFYAINAFV